MRIDQLRYLIEIAKSHSMHATSTKMHISPQALSASIKAMETEIGLALLERSFQGTELTPLGEEISVLAEAFIEKLDTIIAAHRNPDEAKQAFFDFNFFPYDEMDNFAPKLITDLLYKSFELPIHTVERSEAEIKAALDCGQLALALAYIYKLNNKTILNRYRDYDCQPLCSMRYCCRTSSSSPLNYYMSVSLKTVFKYPLLHFTPRSGQEFIDFIRVLSDDETADAIRILKHQEVYKEKLINNHGVSLIVDVPYKDKSNIEHIHGTVEIPIKENLQRELCIISKKGAVPDAQTEKFIKILTDHLAYIIREG